MPEWWTYRLSDFLLFSPRTYYRMFELYHGGIWPVHVIALASGASIAALARRVDIWAQRMVAGVLAAWWLWVGIAFHLNRYATINWSAKYFAALFVIQALLLVWHGIIRGRLPVRVSRNPANMMALGILLAASVVYPFAGRLAGREWTQVELLAITPDPTAVATLALLALSIRRAPRSLIVIPVVWCAIGAATLWALGSAETWVVLILGISGLAVAIRESRAAA